MRRKEGGGVGYKTAHLNNLGEKRIPLFSWKLCHPRPILGTRSLNRGVHNLRKWVFRGGTVGQQAQIKDFHNKIHITEKNYIYLNFRSKNSPIGLKDRNLYIPNDFFSNDP